MKKKNIIVSTLIATTASLLIGQPLHSQFLTKGIRQNIKSEDFVTKIVSLRNRNANDVYNLVQNLKTRIDINCDLSTWKKSGSF